MMERHQNEVAGNKNRIKCSCDGRGREGEAKEGGRASKGGKAKKAGTAWYGYFS